MTFKNKCIRGFTFMGSRQSVSEWKELLVGLCEMLNERHPNEFPKRVIRIRGSKLTYFSEDPGRAAMREPRPIPGSTLYVETKWDADAMYNRCLQVLHSLGYSERDLIVEVHD